VEDPATLKPSPRVVISTLGVTQILAWGSSFYLPAVRAEPLAADIGCHWPGSWVGCPPACSQRVWSRRGSGEPSTPGAAARCSSQAPSSWDQGWRCWHWRTAFRSTSSPGSCKASFAEGEAQSRKNFASHARSQNGKGWLASQPSSTELGVIGKAQAPGRTDGMPTHLSPRLLRAWADWGPDGRSHRQASAGIGRAGVHPSWHGLIEQAVTPAASKSTYDVRWGEPDMGIEIQSARDTEAEHRE
jgi:hypothetical protein